GGEGRDWAVAVALETPNRTNTARPSTRPDTDKPPGERFVSQTPPPGPLPEAERGPGGGGLAGCAYDSFGSFAAIRSRSFLATSSLGASCRTLSSSSMASLG